MQPTFTVILGESKGRKDYFRAFTTAIPKPADQTDRAAQLLPHRMKKTMRLYGVSPLILLKKAKYRKPTLPTKPKDAAVGNPLSVAAAGSSSKKQANFKTKMSRNNKKAAKNDGKPIDTRVNGVEIAPNFSEENEFDFAEGDILFEADKLGEEDLVAFEESNTASSIPLPEEGKGQL